jgi:hypothetical protein
MLNVSIKINECFHTNSKLENKTGQEQFQWLILALKIEKDCTDGQKLLADAELNLVSGWKFFK